LSVAVNVAAAGIASHCTVVFAGTTDNTGAVVSMKLMCCERVLVLPQASVAVHVRVMPPVPGVGPLVVVCENDTMGLASQLSVAVKVAADGMASHCTVTSAGAALSTGPVVSCAVTICCPVLVFPHASVAVQVLVIV
jgi:hypothetical protein